MKITNKSVMEALEGLPRKKHHCSNLGADALHRAIEDYRAKQAGRVYGKPEDSPEVCQCPVCDVTDPEEAPYCASVVCTRVEIDYRLSQGILKWGVLTPLAVVIARCKWRPLVTMFFPNGGGRKRRSAAVSSCHWRIRKNNRLLSVKAKTYPRERNE